jgi:hypothetical protein
MNGAEDFSFLYMNLSNFNNSAIREAIEKALLLTVGLWIPTKDNIKLLVSYAYKLAKNFAVNVEYISKDTVKDLIVLAEKIASKLKEKVNV